MSYFAQSWFSFWSSTCTSCYVTCHFPLSFRLSAAGFDDSSRWRASKGWPTCPVPTSFSGLPLFGLCCSHAVGICVPSQLADQVWEWDAYSYGASVLLKMTWGQESKFQSFTASTDSAVHWLLWGVHISCGIVDLQMKTTIALRLGPITLPKCAHIFLHIFPNDERMKISETIIILGNTIASFCRPSSIFVSICTQSVQESRRAYVSPSRVEPLYKLYWKNGQVCALPPVLSCPCRMGFSAAPWYGSALAFANKTLFVTAPTWLNGHTTVGSSPLEVSKIYFKLLLLKYFEVHVFQVSSGGECNDVLELLAAVAG